MWAVLLLFDHALGLRRSCSEEWFWRGGGGVLALILGVPCSPLSRLISLRRCWFSAWDARRSALTSSRARSSAMLCRSSSSSISPRLQEREVAYIKRHYASYPMSWQPAGHGLSGPDY